MDLYFLALNQFLAYLSGDIIFRTVELFLFKYLEFKIN